MLGIFLDTETNGLNFQRHKLLEIAFKVIDVGTGVLNHEFQAVVSPALADWEKSDANSLQVNGFTWDEVSRGQKKEAVADEILKDFTRLRIKRGQAVFICQNPSFDRAFFSQLIDPDKQESLSWPYHWLDLASMYWVESIRFGKDDPLRFPWATGFSKDRISAVYHLPSEAKPHRAMNGVNHLLLCYEAVVGFPNKNPVAFNSISR